MSLHLQFTSPIRKTDDQQQLSYFQFTQTTKNTHYNIQWKSNETLVVPDDVLTSILEEFLQYASSFFVKPPSVHTMKKHMEHVIVSPLQTAKEIISQVSYDCNIYPSIIDVYAKKTVLGWQVYNKTEVKDPLPEQIPSDFLSESRPASPVPSSKTLTDTRNIVITSDPVQNAIMEAVADIPLQGSAHPFRLDDDAEEKMYRLRVMEARLSAKLASFKAQKEREKYYSKFGRLPPDVADSDDEDETDYSDSSEEENEEDGNGSGGA